MVDAVGTAAILTATGVIDLFCGSVARPGSGADTTSAAGGVGFSVGMELDGLPLSPVGFGDAVGAGSRDGVSAGSGTAGCGAGVDVGSIGAEVDSGPAGVWVGTVLPDVPVVVWALTTTPAATVIDVVLVPVGVVLLATRAVSVFGEVEFGEVDVGEVIPDDGDDTGLGSALTVGFEDDPGFTGLEIAASEVDESVDPIVSSLAAATPCPLTMAVPTPKATAKPPTRPMYVAAPMVSPSIRVLFLPRG